MSTTTTITAKTMRDAQTMIDAYRKLHGPAALFFRGKVKSLDLAIDAGKVYDFGGSLPVSHFDLRRLVGSGTSKVTQEPHFYVYLLGDRAAWPVFPADQTGYEFEIVAEGAQPSVPETVIDADALWPTWAAETRAIIAKQDAEAAAKSVKPAKASKTRTTAAPAEPKGPGVGDLQKQINELVAAMTQPGADFAALGSQIAALKGQQDAVKAEQDAKREARLEATKAKVAAEAEAAKLNAYQAIFQPRFDALLAERRSALDAAQAAVDALLSVPADEMDGVAIKAAAGERDNARKAFDAELIKVEIEQQIAAEQAPKPEAEAPATDEQAAPEAPVEPEQPTVEPVVIGSEALGLTEEPIKIKKSKKAA